MQFFFFGIDLLSSSFAILSIRDELFQCSPKVFIGANEIVCYRYGLDVNFPVNIMPNQGTEKPTQSENFYIKFSLLYSQVGFSLISQKYRINLPGITYNV